MAVLQGSGQNLPPHVCVIQKTPCGIGLRCSTVVECNRIVIVLLLKSPEKLYLFRLAFIEMQTCPLLFSYHSLACVYCLSRI